MNALDFLQLLLPEDGWLVGLAKKGEQRHQWAFDKIESLLETQQKYDRQGWDVYHACASFKHRRGDGKFKLRGHANVLSVRSLWLDVDTRESKPKAKYADRWEAFEAVDDFRLVAGLPTPLYVSSGAGLHCYWPLECELALDEFRILATGLKLCAERLGLDADPARTADASSILRTPGTTHHGVGRPVECGEAVKLYPLECFEHLKGFASDRPRQTAAAKLPSSPLARAAGSIYGDEPSDPASIRKHCQQVGRFAASPGLSSEPVHYSVAGLCAACGPDGTEFYVGLLDPEWRDAGRAKAAQWQGQTSGPPTCAHFESINPGGCKGCPHQGKIKSPIILGRGYVEPPKQKVNGHATGLAEAKSEIELPDLPPPWAWSNTGQLILPQEDKSGRQIPSVVSEYPIYLCGVHRTETVGAVSYAFKQYLPLHGWKDITIPASTIFSGHALGQLAEAGAVVREPKLFTAYVHDARDAWHKVSKMADRYEQCGWKDHEKSFLVGDQLYTSTGVATVTVNEELATRAQYLRPTPNGDVRAWTRTVNKLFAGSMPALTALLASFAAPLMRFHTRHEGGAVLSLLNRRSGTGKTMALEGAISVWGDPQGLSMTSIDTQASKGLIFAAVANLPVMFDELASIVSTRRPEDLKNLIDMFSSGHDRRRALQHGEGLRHTQGSWQTVLLTASNISIVDQLEVFSKGTDAPGFRVLEVKADFPQRFDYATGDRLKAELFENAGHAGDAFLRHLMNPDVLEFAKKSVAQAADEIWRATSFKPQHRFWVRLLSCMAAAGGMVRSLGLLQVDVEEVIRWNLEQLGHRSAPVTGEESDSEERRKEDLDNEAVAVLDEFCRHHLRDTLVVQNAWDPKSRATEPVRAPTGKLLLRNELQTGRLFVPAKTFRTWIVEQGYTYTDVIRALSEGEILKNPKRMVTLGAGTTLASAPVACCEFDMGHPAVSLIARMVKDPQLKVV